MPEIAEAYTMASILKEKLLSSKLGSCKGSLTILNVQSREFGVISNVLPMIILDIYAYGKKVIFSTDKGLIVFSLGMNGTFLFKRSQRWHTTFQFGYCQKVGNMYITDHEIELYFHVDETGRVDFLSSMDEQSKYFSKIGPDLLRYPPDSLSFLQKLRSYNQNKQVCELLLDQSVYSGIGNYLKSEILYLAQIHPASILSCLKDTDIEGLRLCIIDRVTQAYKDRGHHIRDYILPDETTGHYIPIVYGRDRDLDGNEIMKQKFNDGRWTYYSPVVQPII